MTNSTFIYLDHVWKGGLRGQHHPAVSIDSSFNTRLGLCVVLRQKQLLDLVFSRDSCVFLPLCSAGELCLSIERGALQALSSFDLRN